MKVSTLIELLVWFGALNNSDIVVTVKNLSIMEATCKSCNHWEDEAPAVQNQDNFGECEVLTDSGMKFVLPVIQDRTMQSTGIITSADFGCNQFAA
ncbi:MAG: hypothetical protein ACI81P_002796 [Neolewinella sp.]|jgi:hypothetical protein